jgi:FkbM family methyltransferase
MRRPPAALTIEERIAMTARCRDCDALPKVADAGRVFATADSRRVQIMHNGLKVVADGYCGPWMTDLIRLCHGHHEPQEERIFHDVVRCLPRNARMIELGGNWSYYSLWFLLNEPMRRAVILEPDPANLDVGRANAAINRLSPEFHLGFAGRVPAAARMFQTERSGEIELACFSVEQLLTIHQWPKLDLLHCDVQGAEFDILEGCRELFRSGAIDWVFVSTHAHQISGDPLLHLRCLEFLRDCDAIIEAEHDVHESFSGDGLIVARFCAPPVGWTTPVLSYNRQSQSLFRALAYDLDDCLRRTSAGDAPGDD